MPSLETLILGILGVQILILLMVGALIARQLLILRELGSSIEQQIRMIHSVRALAEVYEKLWLLYEPKPYPPEEY